MTDRDDNVKIDKDGLYRMGEEGDRNATQFQYFAGDTVPKVVKDRLTYVGPIPDKTVDRTTEYKGDRIEANKAAPAPENKKA